LGLNLGQALPCFSCPFVGPGCAGSCYLIGLQGRIGFGMVLEDLTSAWVWHPIGQFLLFLFLLSLLGKAWCGWICPFGLVQDWLTLLRQKLAIREMVFTPAWKKGLAPIKYVLLGYLILVPPLVTAGILHDDFFRPFCNICPGRSIMPLFALNTSYLAINNNNDVFLGLSLTLLAVTGGLPVGMFFKERFFCVFCPMLALIHVLKPMTILGLIKEPRACIGCGNCQRACPMDVTEVHLEKVKPDVQTPECIDCASCVEACASDGALTLKFWKFKLFTSSRRYAAGLAAKPGRRLAQ
jgi:polyferredoxin